MKLYDCRSSSNYGKYHYDVKGILNSVPSIGYREENLIVSENDLPIIKKFLEDNRASYRTRKVIPDDEVEKLRLHSAKIFVQHSIIQSNVY